MYRLKYQTREGETRIESDLTLQQIFDCLFILDRYQAVYTIYVQLTSGDFIDITLS